VSGWTPDGERLPADRTVHGRSTEPTNPYYRPRRTGDVLFPTHLLAAGVVGRASRLSTPWLVAGAAAPDLLDKPLAMAGLVDLFHSVGHSVLLLPFVVPLALYDRAALAAAVGWALHLSLDAIHVVLNGRPEDVLSLAWPLAAPADPLALPPVPFVVRYVGTPSFFLEAAMWLVAGVVVLYHRTSRQTDDTPE